jgi:spore maturation protein CgeB
MESRRHKCRGGLICRESELRDHLSMRLVVFGLSISSSWGNGHAPVWRGLCRALGQAGHEVCFFERNTPYYARIRDLGELDRFRMILYDNWSDAALEGERRLRGADCGLVTSDCPDGAQACRLVLGSAARTRVFYDLDAPVTLERVARGERVEYLPEDGLGGFDRVLSFTGGRWLRALEERVGARRAAALYAGVDPDVHRPQAPSRDYRAELSYLGTYAADRQARLEALLLAPARNRPDASFLVAGPLYPLSAPWPPNVRHLEHVALTDHAALYCSSSLTLDVTRTGTAALGHCPSPRLFEAAACGAPVLSDGWPGLDELFAPGEEVLLARTTEDALAALALPAERLRAIGRAARARVLAQHTAAHRARELVALIEGSRAGAGEDGGEHARDHSVGGDGEPDPTAGVFEGAAPRR